MKTKEKHVTSANQRKNYNSLHQYRYTSQGNFFFKFFIFRALKEILINCLKSENVKQSHFLCSLLIYWLLLKFSTTDTARIRWNFYSTYTPTLFGPKMYPVICFTNLSLLNKFPVSHSHYRKPFQCNFTKLKKIMYVFSDMPSVF